MTLPAPLRSFARCVSTVSAVALACSAPGFAQDDPLNDPPGPPPDEPVGDPPDPGAGIGPRPDGDVPRFAVLGGSIVFSGSDDNGFEPWTSNGTGEGTRMLLNIATQGSSNPGEFTTLGGAVYFAAERDLDGRELWRTDGSTAGTKLVADLNPGSELSNP